MLAEKDRVRFWSKVDDSLGPENCWFWTANTNRRGYGKFWMNTRPRTRLAHRVSYAALVGDIPNGLQLDHLCRNPACVNPLHLEPVTMQENIRRGPTSFVNRKSCPKGHPYDETNTYLSKTGSRVCRVCRVAHNRSWRERKKALEKEAK